MVNGTGSQLGGIPLEAFKSFVEGKEGVKLQLIASEEVDGNHIEGVYVFLDNTLDVERVTNQNDSLQIYLTSGEVLGYGSEGLYTSVIEGDTSNGHIIVDDQTQHFLKSKSGYLTEEEIKALTV